jgi:hypothetical protein
VIGEARIDGSTVEVSAAAPATLPLGATGYGVVDATGRALLVVVLPPGVRANIDADTAIAIARLQHGQSAVLSDGTIAVTVRFRVRAVAVPAVDIGRSRCDVCRAELAEHDLVWPCPECRAASCADCAASDQCIAIDCGAARPEEAP